MRTPDAAIETFGLTRKFGKQDVVDNLSLTVPKGSVYAFLGRNGAGKTTTIRMLMNMLDPSSGEARVLGLHPRKQSLEIRKRVGYVADGLKMYDWMTVGEIIWFCKGFYETWDDAYQQELLKKLELNPAKKLSELSRGMYSKVALLLALSYHPELLILDEPTAGLDVVVRRDFIEGVIELISQQERTVFFSSHQVNEVERVADWVGIIDKGSMLYSGPVEKLKEEVKLLYVNYDNPPQKFAIPGLLRVDKNGRQAALTVRQFSEDTTIAAVKSIGMSAVNVLDMNLEDIFIALVGDHTGQEAM